MRGSQSTGRAYTPPRMQFESVVMELVGFSAQDVITTSNATGWFGEEFDIFGNQNDGQGGEQA